MKANEIIRELMSNCYNIEAMGEIEIGMNAYGRMERYFGKGTTVNVDADEVKDGHYVYQYMEDESDGDLGGTPAEVVYMTDEGQTVYLWRVD